MDKKKTDFVEGVDVLINAIEVETNQFNRDEVKRISFVTSKGNITWKPKHKKEEFRDGLKVQSVVPLCVDDLPEKLRDMGKKIRDEGKIKVIVNYTTMTVDKDGEEVTYRFITSAKTFNDWKMLNEKIPEETIQ